MYNGKRILAVVPARGGSKGIPGKNLARVGGIPLVARVGAIIRELPEIDRAIVSTDSLEIANVAEASGISAPFMRPPELSGDRIGDWDVLNHALSECERMDNCRYDIVLMLQPTCPLRQAKHVRRVLEKLVTEGWDATWTVSETDSKGHPLKQLIVAPNGGVDYYDQAGKAIVARQQLTPVYHRNGAAYAFTRECIFGQKTTFGKKSAVVIISDPMANIDTKEDLEFADYILERETRGS